MAEGQVWGQWVAMGKCQNQEPRCSLSWWRTRPERSPKDRGKQKRSPALVEEEALGEALHTQHLTCIPHEDLGNKLPLHVPIMQSDTEPQRSVPVRKCLLWRRQGRVQEQELALSSVILPLRGARKQIWKGHGSRLDSQTALSLRHHPRSSSADRERWAGDTDVAEPHRESVP